MTAFPTTAPAALSNGKYNAVSQIKAQFSTAGKLGFIYREGVSDVGVGDFGIMRMVVSTDNGATFGSPTTLVSEAGRDLRAYCGGVTSTGRLVIFWGRYIQGGGGWQTLSTKYSDDDGATWSAVTTPSHGSDTTFAPAGKLVDLGGGTLMMTWYGWNGTTYSVYAIFSTDNGATWGNQETIVTATGGLQYTEVCCTKVAGGVIGLVRENNGTKFRQVKRDLAAAGSGTWTNQGDVSFDSWASGSGSTPWVETFSDSGVETIAAYWYNRDAGELRVSYCTSTNALAGVGSWAAPGGVNYWSLQSGYATGSNAGAPAVFQDPTSKYCLGAFYNDQAMTDLSADLNYFILNINVGNRAKGSTVGGVSATLSRIYISGAYTAPVDGILTGISVYADGAAGSASGTQQLYPVVYEDSSGAPGAKVAVAPADTVTAGDTGVWHRKASSTNPAISAAKSYWTGHHHGPVSGGDGNAVIDYWRDTSGATLKYQQDALNTDPDPFGVAENTIANFKLSAFLTYAPTIAFAPVNTVAPIVSGLTPAGSTLSGTNGTWDGIPTSYTYQWTRDGVPIGGATGSTYVTQAADVGHAVGRIVTAVNASGSMAQASSNAITVTSAGGGGTSRWLIASTKTHVFNQ